MKYANLMHAIAAMSSGKNITDTLKKLATTDVNTNEIIEIAYDLQAGSYIADLNLRKNEWDAYHGEVASIVKRVVGQLPPQPRILDAGTGEMTTLCRVLNAIENSNPEMYCCDISFSRINVGRKYLLSKMADVDLFPCVATISELPFLDDSIDLVFTSHAIEPNGGRELELISELFRVSKSHVLLFEPSFENNSLAGKERMQALGYVKGLPDAIKMSGGVMIDYFPMKNPLAPLNPTWVYLCRKEKLVGEKKGGNSSPWACPLSKLPAENFNDCFYCHDSRLAYPVIQGIPVMRVESAILASVW